MDDLGLLSYYPGIEVQQKTDGITLCQEAYTRKILESPGMKYCNPIDAPTKPCLELNKKSKAPVVNAIEYIAAATAACEGVWLGRLHGDLMDRDPEQVVLNVDSKSESFIREDSVRHDRSKHTDTVYHYIKDCVEEAKMKVNYVCTDDQMTDILTKVLDREKLLEMQRRIGVGAVT